MRVDKGRWRRRARKGSWPTAPAASARARACRWPRGSPCRDRRPPRARGRRRSAPGGRRSGAPPPDRGSADAPRSAGPPTWRKGGCPPIRWPARAPRPPPPPASAGPRSSAPASGVSRQGLVATSSTDSMSSGFTCPSASDTASSIVSIEFDSSSVSASRIMSSSSMPMVYAGPVNRCSTRGIVSSWNFEQGGGPQWRSATTASCSSWRSTIAALPEEVVRDRGRTDA